MSRKTKIISILLLIGISLGIGLLFIYLKNKKAEFNPSDSTVRIKLDMTKTSNSFDLPTGLDKFSRREIADYRMAQVNKYKEINIFPANYHPLQVPHQSIYGRIHSNGPWLYSVPYYIANPYILIVAAQANHVTPLNFYCPDAEITYTYKKITEIHRGENAHCWLRAVFTSMDYPGVIRLFTVNAEDAGFYYAYLDESLSSNIKEADDLANIANSIYCGHNFYHFGQYKKNNLSPEDRRCWIALKKSDYTRLVIKLWQDEPKNSQKPADLIYEIVVIPDNEMLLTKSTGNFDRSNNYFDSTDEISYKN